MSFLKKTNLGTPASTTPKLGATLGAKKLGGGMKLNTQPKEIDLEAAPSKPSLGAKKLGGAGLGKKLTAKSQKTIEEPVVEQEEVIEEKPAIKKLEIKEETEDITVEESPIQEQEEEIKVEEEETPKKKTTTKKKTSSSKKKAEEQIVAELEVDESKRVGLEEMDTIMRPIVAPTTESWEQEKKDVLDALNNIVVEQDMTMGQVKNCLADLDELNFEILPKLHDAETMYDGTKQNYDTVKSIAISRGNATNAEGRKAEGIIACQNFVTPSGAVVDLHQYMLLIEERYKFYQKIVDGINFKKYSLVNYNNALKVESKNA